MKRRTLDSPSEAPVKFYKSQEERSLSLKKNSGLAIREVFAKIFKKHSSPSSSGHQLDFYKCATCIQHFAKVTDLIYDFYVFVLSYSEQIFECILEQYDI